MNGPSSSIDRARSPDEQEGGAELTRPEDENAHGTAPSTRNAAVDATDRSMVNTDLSRLRREQSFVNFTDRRVGRATSSNLPNPGKILDQMPQDGDTWVIRPRTSIQEERSTTANEGGSRVGSDEDLSEVTPLLSLPGSPPASLRRETASLSSTGATAGDSVMEEAKVEPAKPEQSPFTKERRAQLMAVMAADIARYSQEREWEFYREHGYGVLPKVGTPEPVHETASANRDSIIPAAEAEGSNRLRLRFEREIIRPFFRAHRESNRATLPAESLEPGRVTELPDDEEEFLFYLLNRIATANSRRQTVQDEIFEERRIPPERARLRFYLVESTSFPPVAADQAAFRRMVNILRLERREAIRIVRAIWDEEQVDSIDVGRYTPLEAIMLAAERDGMDIAEGILFLTEWFHWLERAAETYPTPEGFLDIQTLQFWVALRRGWGNWHPSRAMLDEVRAVLLDQANFNHIPNTDWSLSFRHSTLATIRGSALPPGEKARLEKLLEDGVSAVRVSQIYANWRSFITRGFRLNQDPAFRFDRLERLIREERVVNARRRVRWPDGQ